MVNQSLRANHLFFNGRDYIVKDNQIIIIDEQTGRQLPGRRFGDCLHQSIEAKEKVKVQSEKQTVASITTQLRFIFAFLHLISKNFSAPRSAPKPASVTTYLDNFKADFVAITELHP